MNDSDVFGGVGMRVVFGRLAVGGPACVADTGVTLERSLFQPRFEIPELAFGAAAFETVAFQRRNARGIIAAIFEALERVYQLLGDRPAPENADDSAHAVCCPRLRSPRQFLTNSGRAKILNNYCRLRQR